MSTETLPHSSDVGAAALLAQALPWLAPGLTASLQHAFVRRQFARGAVLLRQGNLSTQVLLVERGVLRLGFTRADGREFNKNFFAEGQIVLPLTRAMAQEPSLFGVSALTPAVLHVAELQAFQALLRSAGAWHTVQRKLLAAMVDHKLRREQELLALSGRERYLRFCETRPDVSRRLPVGELASYLGLTAVSLSRIRGQRTR